MLDIPSAVENPGDRNNIGVVVGGIKNDVIADWDAVHFHRCPGLPFNQGIALRHVGKGAYFVANPARDVFAACGAFSSCRIYAAISRRSSIAAGCR